MWSEHGWKKITVNEAARLHSGGTVSVASGLFPWATSQAGMLACTFGDCREGQIPRCSAALQIWCPVACSGGFDSCLNYAANMLSWQREKNVRHFRHKISEKSKDCPERTFGPSIILVILGILPLVDMQLLQRFRYWVWARFLSCTDPVW